MANKEAADEAFEQLVKDARDEFQRLGDEFQRLPLHMRLEIMRREMREQARPVTIRVGAGQIIVEPED